MRAAGGREGPTRRGSGRDRRVCQCVIGSRSPPVPAGPATGHAGPPGRAPPRAAPGRPGLAARISGRACSPRRLPMPSDSTAAAFASCGSVAVTGTPSARPTSRGECVPSPTRSRARRPGLAEHLGQHLDPGPGLADLAQRRPQHQHHQAGRGEHRLAGAAGVQAPAVGDDVGGLGREHGRQHRPGRAPARRSGAGRRARRAAACRARRRARSAAATAPPRAASGFCPASMASASSPFRAGRCPANSPARMSPPLGSHSARIT